MVICLEWGADLHMAQLMPLPLTVSCFSKIQIGLPFWYRLTWVVPDKGLLNVCVIFVAVACYLRYHSHNEPWEFHAVMWMCVNVMYPCCSCPVHRPRRLSRQWLFRQSDWRAFDSRCSCCCSICVMWYSLFRHAHGKDRQYALKKKTRTLFAYLIVVLKKALNI